MKNHLSTSLKSFLAMATVVLIAGIYGCESTPNRSSTTVEVGNEGERITIVFSDHDRETIRRHYSHSKQKKVPPGLARKNQLPPGLEKQVMKHGRLPPGLEGRSLPHDLERRLTPLPEGYVRIRLGKDILLMEVATRLILDVISDVTY